jgi:hypothetical protein
MSPDALGTNSSATGREPLPQSAVDAILVAQIAVAWAGESGEEPRLGWWRSDLVSEFGGEDLFKRLLPHTWQWAVLQAVREAARIHDAGVRSRDHNPDRILSLYSLGFELDERIEERLQDHKRSGVEPVVALPGLASVLRPDWNQSAFEEWVEAHTAAEYTVVPVGRRLKGNPPSTPETLAAKLVSALLPFGSEYPLPHFRRAE